MRKWEQHNTNKWVRSSASAYAYVAGVFMLTRECLCLCYAYEALVRTGLKCEARIIPAKTKCEARTISAKTKRGCKVFQLREIRHFRNLN